MLLGREAERERIDRALDAARSGHATALALHGEAGIGKTTLLDYAAAQGREMQVVRVRALESEADVAFAGLADVCRPLLGLLDALPRAQADALRNALALEPAHASARTDKLTVGAATLSLLAAAAESRPLLLIVDDADWLDGPSAAAVLFAARRLEADAVAVLFAARGRGPAVHGLEELHVAGLDEPAAHELLTEASPSECAPEVAERLIKSTRGNPLALIELPLTLTEQQRRGEAPLDDPIRVGADLERAFAHRVAKLGEDARRALLVAAASDTDEFRPIVDALERLELDRRFLESAEDDGLVRIDGGRLEFWHPLVRSAVYYGAAASERRQAHRVLAEALAEVDEQRRAWHVAAAAFGPDEDAARLLEAAGSRSRDRGAYASAAAAFERAVRLGDSARRGARLVLAADAAWLAGDASSATRLVEEGLEDDAAAEVLGDLIALRARIELHCGSQERAFRWFVDAADLVEPTRPDRAAEMLADAISAGLQSAGPELQDVARRLEGLPNSDDPMVELLLAQASALAASVTGTSKGVVALRDSIEAALDGRGTALQPPLHLYWVSRGYWMLGRNADASSVASEGVRRAREGEASGLLPQLLRVLALADFDRGDWYSARAAAAEGAELAEELGQTTTQCGCLALLAELEAAVGDEATCRQHARRAVEIGRTLGLDFHRERAERALGRLELALGKLDPAAVQLEAVAERLARSGNREFNVTPLADLVEVCARRSAPREAESALARLEALALDLMIGEEAILARCRGIVADEHSFGYQFAKALELHEADLFPFERARTELCFGERLRRRGERRAARKQLQASAATFEELGAVAWTSRAHDELRASGARLRTADAEGRDFLTPREAQIAEQVAQGKANREVAAALYLTPKTVEFHLTRIYRKLGIRSRTELVREFGR